MRIHVEPVIQLRSAVVVLGRYPALAGVDLDVSAGEIVLLRGPNGAGKSTVLRVCAGLVPVQRGSAMVLGHELSVDRRAVRRLVGLLGHSTGLYDDLTVRQNVAFWARATASDGDTVGAALDRVRLPERVRDLGVEQLSAGQRRRVSLAAMLVRRPRLWLLDEPHAGLDAEARDVLDALILEATGTGVTVVFASHELDRSEAIATRQITIASGVVSADVRSAGPVGATVSAAVEHVS